MSTPREPAPDQGLHPRRGILLVVSGPSGVGKNRLINELRRLVPDLRYSTSVTTRSPRPGEQNGVNYYFVSRECFEQWKRENRLLEWAQYCGHYYGTPADFIERELAAGQTVVMDVETSGAAQIRRRLPEAVMVFVLPPSLSELRHRLEKRGTDEPAVIRDRLRSAYSELLKMQDYDYVVLNDSLTAAVNNLAAIVQAERLRVSRSDYGQLLAMIRQEEQVAGDSPEGSPTNAGDTRDTRNTRHSGPSGDAEL